MASDGSGEIDLLFSEKTGKELIGKLDLSLICSQAPHGVSIEEAVQFACMDQ